MSGPPVGRFGRANRTLSCPRIQVGRLGFVDPAVLRGADPPVWHGVRVLVAGEQTDGAFAIVEIVVAPRGLVAPPHVHTREDELIHVLEGRLAVSVGEHDVVAGPGDSVLLRNVAHSPANPDDTPARALFLFTPAGFEGFFVALDAPDADVEETMARFGV